jgi:hypothetical protein
MSELDATADRLAASNLPRKGETSMENIIGQTIGLVLPAVAVVSVFTFVAVATWSDNRRKERESYYKHETYRKMLEQSGGSDRSVMDLMRQEEEQQMRRRIEGLRLGGLITTVVGAGVMVFLYVLVDEEPVYVAGLIPLLIGLVLTFYGFFMAPRAPTSHS